MEPAKRGDLVGRDVLQRVVTELREEHRACRHGTTVCNLGGCPWPNMHEEDVTELHHKIAKAGYGITRQGTEESTGGRSQG